MNNDFLYFSGLGTWYENRNRKNTARPATAFEQLCSSLAKSIHFYTLGPAKTLSYTVKNTTLPKTTTKLSVLGIPHPPILKSPHRLTQKTDLEVERQHIFPPPRLALPDQVAAVRAGPAGQHARRGGRSSQRPVEPRPLREGDTRARLAGGLFCY